MHVLFVHKNFPAQFGHIAARLISERGHRCSFLSETPEAVTAGIRKLHYKAKGGATEATHYYSRTFENGIWNAEAVRQAAVALDGDPPDLIVGHSGFGTTLFLRDRFKNAGLINYFEYYYRPDNSDLDFRADFPVAERDRLRSRARNAMILLDLEHCDAGYAPTPFQRSVLPSEFRDKVRVLHDGIPTDVWFRHDGLERRVGEHRFGPGTKLITYVSRGFESMRGFDIFMRAAKKICDRDPDVLFAVVGEDRIAYGGDEKHIDGKSFKAHVLAQDDYDLDRILFLGRLRPKTLAKLLSLSDLHVYLTVPFVLSWSLMDAMACGCAILASDTAPVRDVIAHGSNGLLVDFFDVDGLAGSALDLLSDPQLRRRLGAKAAATIAESYSSDIMFPQIADFYEEVAAGLGGKS